MNWQVHYGYVLWQRSMAMHDGHDFRFVKNAVGFFGGLEDGLHEFRGGRDAPL